MMKIYWVILWSLWAARLVRQPTVPVRVSGGWLRGDVAHDGSHKRYMAIPFATPPVRFQGPGPEPSWQGMYEAVNEHVRCFQRIGASILVGQEDCLVVNVFTPLDATPASNYSVMVYIHEGAFYEGSSSRVVHGPNYLVSKGVIMVSFNYRITVQGFICLRIKDAPGNAGMKDQVAALKWIKRNIQQFGGNPNSVTLFGISAGATSISFHMLSPMSKGLFHKAIIQSGASLSPWALQFKPVYMASLLTKAMGYSTEDPYEIYDILMKKSDRELLVNRVPRKENDVIISELLHTPCVEAEIEGVEPFLTELPFDLLSRGEYYKVPTIIGVTLEEGLLFVNMENSTTIPKIVFEKAFPKSLHIPLEKRSEIGRKLMEYYMDNKNISYETLGNLSRFHGELYCTVPALQETELFLETNHNPVYSYIFAYDGWRNLLKITLFNGLNKMKGATHADDIFYVFNQKFIPNFFETKMIDIFTTMWTNFAKYSDPTPQTTELLPVKWLPANKTSPHSFVIDKEFSTKPLWFSDSLKYLREIFYKYRRTKD